MVVSEEDFSENVKKGQCPFCGKALVKIEGNADLFNCPEWCGKIAMSYGSKERR